LGQKLITRKVNGAYFITVQISEICGKHRYTAARTRTRCAFVTAAEFQRLGMDGRDLFGRITEQAGLGAVAGCGFGAVERANDR
jgi:hypothetical protein